MTGFGGTPSLGNLHTWGYKWRIVSEYSQTTINDLNVIGCVVGCGASVEGFRTLESLWFFGNMISTVCFFAFSKAQQSRS